MEEILEMTKYALIGINILLFLSTALVFFSRPPRSTISGRTKTADNSQVAKRALLVTAHPDDESMFFLPLLHSFHEAQGQNEDDDAEWDVHLLCLSRGNFDGLGDIRAKEMVACGEFIGLKKTNIYILEDPKLQDGMQTIWDHDHIARLVLDCVDKHNIDAVFTFDDYGVSGHPNHIAVHFGVKLALEEQHRRCSQSDSSRLPVRGWALESTNIVRKYIGLVDAVISSWLAGPTTNKAFVFLFKPQWNYHAMELHHSQFVWYRRLFVIFSRYTFVNTFTPLVHKPTSIEDKKIQ